jgi:hypothetical protein
VRLLRAWREHHIPLATILQEPWRFEGTHVRTSGTITERRLTTDHDAFGIPLRGRFEAQGPTIVEGLVEFDASLAQFHLQVERAQPMAGSP